MRSAISGYRTARVRRRGEPTGPPGPRSHDGTRDVGQCHCVPAIADHALVVTLTVLCLGALSPVVAGDSVRDAVTSTIRRATAAVTAPSGPALPVDVVGNLRTARYVVVLVPGTGSDARSHPALVARARSLAAAMREHDPSVAVVAWTGYRAPPGLLDAAKATWAREGAPRLAAYLQRLSHGHGRGPQVTVVGHSYGAVVAARAAALGAPMRRLVLVGSPGYGRPFRTAADLRRPDVAVWSADAYDDPIRWLHVAGGVDVHGGDTGASDSGSLRIPVGAHDDHGRTRHASTGHSGYFDPGTAGFANIARVAVGGVPVPDPPLHSRPAGPP